MSEPVASVEADLAAEWTIHLPDGIHKVKFEHGTTSGKRVIWVDGQEVRNTLLLFVVCEETDNFYTYLYYWKR